MYTIPEETIYTVQEAAEKLNLTYPQTARLVRKGKINAFKLGKHEWFIKKRDLEAYEKNSISKVT